jgi:DNA invertase Pin-like site-specific DNA recombinase
VQSGNANYKAILVYDVSRWGRFPNNDEAAYYEFICHKAGIPLHYCAEPFTNDGTAASSLLKALKRSMAGRIQQRIGRESISRQDRDRSKGILGGGATGLWL